MKKIEFKTSKGEFVLVDDIDTDIIAMCKIFDNPKIFKYGLHLKPISKLSEITEQQASEIVDSDDDYGVVMYQNYQTTSMQYFDEQLTAIDSLHSLLKSKGVHLYENPYEPYWRTSDYMFAEQNTFYNPYLFKKI